MTSAPAIGFEYRPSRWPARLLTAWLVLALIAVVSCSLAWWMKGVVAALLLGAWRRALRHPADAGVTAAGWGSRIEDEWRLQRWNGADVPAELVSFRALGAFVLLRLRHGDGSVCVLWLAPDNSDSDIRRQLRMRLAAVHPGNTPRHA